MPTNGNNGVDQPKCPHCGYCHHCGRADRPAPRPYPVYPQPYWTNPYPYWYQKPYVTYCSSSSAKSLPSTYVTNAI